MVRLRELYMLLSVLAILSFNSSMVRLRARRQDLYAEWPQRFNSSMVRLRARNYSRYPIHHQRFQFQYGAIESVTMLGFGGFNQSFQFQYGAIESSDFTDPEAHEHSFNSSMVRLRG